MEKGNYLFVVLRWGLLLVLLGVLLIGSFNYFILERHYNLTAQQRELLQQKAKIVIGGTIEHPPLEYRSQNGKVEGFSSDLLQAIGRELGVEIEFCKMSWTEAFQALEKGEIDALGGVNYQDSRAANWELSRPYLFNPTKILVLKKQGQVKSLADLANKRVGVCPQDYEALNLSMRKEINFLLQESHQQGVQTLLQGQIDAYIGGNWGLLYGLQEEGARKQAKLIPTNLGSPSYCLAVKKGNKDLLALLNSGLFYLEQKGIKRELDGRWLASLSAEKNPLYFAYSRNFLSILVFLLLFGSIFFYYWYKSLQEEISKKSAQLEERNRKLVLLNSISATLNQSLNVENVLSNVLIQLVESLELAGGAISWQKGPSSELITFSSRLASDNFRSLLDEQFWQEKLLEPTKNQQEYLHKDSLEHCCGSLDCCYLGFPLRSKDQILGIMGLLDEKKMIFCQENMELLNNIANQFAVALENAQLYLNVCQANEELAKANETLQKLSCLDGLTGTANRRHFDEILLREWKKGIKDRRPLSLILLDIDYFKNYNDNYGHQEGDSCLKQVAKILEKSLKKSEDLLARYGGEEFAVILPDTNLEGAKIVAERLRRQVEALALTHLYSGVSKTVTISLGVASILPSNNYQSSDLISYADQALYEAKKEGRNQVRVSNLVRIA